MSSDNDINIVFEYAKQRIQNKNYSKNKLFAALIHTLNHFDNHLQDIFTIIKSSNINFKLEVFTCVYYSWCGLIELASIFVKNDIYKWYKNSNIDKKLWIFSDYSLSSYNVFGETLTYLIIGVLYTETLDCLLEIQDDKLYNYFSKNYNIIFNKYYEKYINLLDNDNIEISNNLIEDLINIKGDIIKLINEYQ